MSNRLYRSPTDKVIGGVAGGLAVWMNIDPSLVRIAWVVLAIFSGGIFLLIYFVMMLIVPLPPAGWMPGPGPTFGGPSGPPGPGAIPGWDPGTGAWTATGAARGGVPGTAPDGVPPAGPPGTTGWTTPAGQPGPWGAPRPPAEPSRMNAENAGIVFGAVLVLLGVWFLVDQYVDIDWSLLWPVIVIVLGVVLIAGAVMRGRSSG